MIEMGDIYPYWQREWDALIVGLRETEARLLKDRTPEQVREVFDWIPQGGKRSINDLLRHIAYVEDYIVDKLILDREPKTILTGSVFPADAYPAFEDCMRLLEDTRVRTKIALKHLKQSDLKKEVPAFRRTLPIDRLIWSIVQEETHHRGQVYMLLRMQGIAPPERKD